VSVPLVIICASLTGSKIIYFSDLRTHLAEQEVIRVRKQQNSGEAFVWGCVLWSRGSASIFH